MPGKSGSGNLFHPLGQPITWTAELLDKLQDCVEAEMSIRQMAKHMGMDPYALARGNAILFLRERRGGLGDYGQERL